MEFLCLAPTHIFPTNPKFTAITHGRITNTLVRNMKMYQNMRGSRVRPSALPLKKLISPADSSASVVSVPATLPDVKPGELIVNTPTGGDPEELIQYLLDMLASRVYDVASESPLEKATKISNKLGVEFFIKREDKQSVFSFKLRGAYNMMQKLPKEDLDKGVITASAGNHAQGVALAASKLGCYAKIVMPETTPEIKVEAVRALGGDVVTDGNTFDESKEIALKQAEEFGYIFIPPFDDPEIIKGQAVARVGDYTFAKCQELIDGMVLVDNDGISAGVKDVYDEGRNILETSGALAIAGAEAYCKYYNIKGVNVVAIASGANMDFSKLKLVAELAEIGAEKEALLATFMPEQPGSFKKFIELVGSLNITEFTYRLNSGRKQALVLYSVDVDKKSDVEEMIERMKSSKLNTFNLSKNNLVKEHLRHLIGGASNPSDEIFCQFIFPELPGALRKFLDAFCPRWNITLFRYREQGEVDASVLVGFQVPKSEMDEFQNQANKLGYAYEIESLNEAFNLIVE